MASKKQIETFLEKVKKRRDKAMKADKHNRIAAISDLKMLNNDPSEHWNQAELDRRRRKGRPALIIPLQQKYVDQVAGDCRQNKPRINIIPSDHSANVRVAKVYKGLVDKIWYHSNGDSISDQAFEQALSCGYGGWRILTRYTEENPFLQEIYLEAVPNALAMYLDPDAKDITYADARYGFLLSVLSIAEFEQRWPKKVAPKQATGVYGMSGEVSFQDDKVLVVEYFELDKRTVTMCQLKDGRVVTEKDAKSILEEWQENYEKAMDAAMMLIEKGVQGGIPQGQPATPQGPQGPQGMPPQGMPTGGPSPSMAGGMPPQGMAPQGMAPQGIPPQASTGMPSQGMPQGPSPIPQGSPLLAPPKVEKPEIVKKRDTEETIVRHWILTETDILEGDLEGEIFPGNHIPLILLKGKELNVEGKTYVRSLIRNTKDIQKEANFLHSSAIEVIAQAPKTSFIGTAKQFEGYEQDYAEANVDNFAFLQYNSDPEAPGPPQKLPSVEPPVAILTMLTKVEHDLEACIGMFKADVGDQGPERTGAAIVARQKPGDIGTFAFIDNLSRCIQHTGKILVNMIPAVYDTERDVRLREEDGTEIITMVNADVDHMIERFKRNPEYYSGLDIRELHKLSGKGAKAKFNDLSVGKYDITVTVGASFATRRTESAQQLLQLASMMPQQMGLVADLIVKNLDFDGALELQERLEKAIPVHMRKAKPGEPSPQAPPPSPEIILEMEKVKAQQIKNMAEQEKIKVQQMKLEIEKIKLMNEMQNSRGEIKKLAAEALGEIHGAAHVEGLKQQMGGGNEGY